ncbi:MAG: hypothetical protein WB805_08330 [Candidatus Dormiibacterota bacterium]
MAASRNPLGYRRRATAQSEPANPARGHRLAMTASRSPLRGRRRATAHEVQSTSATGGHDLAMGRPMGGSPLAQDDNDARAAGKGDLPPVRTRLAGSVGAGDQCGRSEKSKWNDKTLGHGENFVNPRITWT